VALVHGRHAVTAFNSLMLTGYLNAAERSTEVDNADTSVYGLSARTNTAGLQTTTFSFEGFYDPDAVPTLTTGLQVDSGVLTFAPGGGAAVGDLARLAAVTATGYGETPSLDGVTAISWAVTSQEYIGLGWVLHPHGEDTNSTTGSTYDGAGATTTGWTAHLHVTAVDAGSWVIKLQDASASNFSDGADVTGGAFTAATGATSQRLQSAAGATLRRYIRYVATRTGGTAGDGITFLLAFSRGR
jgi:hypothetical protein